MATVFGSIFGNSNKYQLHAKLRGTQGPVNCVTFSHDGKLLASGADDQRVHIWDVNEKKSLQKLSDKFEHWGQITCMKWLTFSVATERRTLCFGTGRGLILIYDKGKDSDTFREVSNTIAFGFNDTVECIDYNGNKARLVACSHSGKINMYNVNKKGIPEMLWQKNLFDVNSGKATIPRSVHFVASGESVIICGLESGVVFSKVAATGVDNWNKLLESSLGNTRLSSNDNWLLVDNMVNGFDLYTYPALSRADSFEIERSETYVHDGTFTEGSVAVACGSDHGLVYVFSVKTSECKQRIRHGSRRSKIQALDAVSVDDQHLLASGANDKKPEIIVWKKEKTKKSRSMTGYRCGCSPMVLMIILNILMMTMLAATLGMTREDLAMKIDSIFTRRGNPNRGASFVGADGRPLQDKELRQQLDDALEKARIILQRDGIDIEGPKLDFRKTQVQETEPRIIALQA